MNGFEGEGLPEGWILLHIAQNQTRVEIKSQGKRIIRIFTANVALYVPDRISKKQNN